MSLSVGGYECGYAYPGTMGLSSASAQGYYGVHYPSEIQAYQDYSERDLYNSWVLSAAGNPEMSPDSYGNVSGTPSPTATSQYGYSVAETMQHMSQWRDFQMTDGELALAHNIPVSELGQYEAYTNVYGDRCLRRRTSANRKERRRTLSINNAFSNLRGSIPNVPSDTKLSKIKTLRLAISYISYLNEILEKGDSELAQTGFKADISRKRERRVLPTEKVKKPTDSCDSEDSRDSTGSYTSSRDATGSDCKANISEDDKSNSPSDSKMKGRTGWPQEVWASELKLSPAHLPTDLPSAAGPS
ncbi:heart- and neural crest derivatives-expressed protein 2-like [Mercenaria mercenaria]|uniref:heart- and neural crest derivatives-expressed protein 2-like n=1 Tax=Mercenaria mercenaria TaxID=6596 RepID=UPI001E1D9DA1|nr:heart- and neural crest derivatives-expressed protein 2-like [Mercenaria mercenaria]